MIIETAADRSAYVADFGEIVAIGGQQRIAIVDTEYFEAPVGEVGQEGTQPMLHIPTADLPLGTGEGTAVTARAKSYTIANVEADGTGMSTITLI